MRTSPALAQALLVIVTLASLGIVKGESTDPTYGIGAIVAPDAPAGTPTLEALNVDHLTVIQVIPGGPADKSGLQNGDEIIQVNNNRVAGMKFYDVVTKLIRGKEGTTVKITIKRNGQTTPLSFTIIRAGTPIYSPGH